MASGALQKVMITGGSGKLGSSLCRAFSERHHSVVALDRREPDAVVANVTYHRVDLANLEEILHTFVGVDTVVHTASLHGMHLPHYDPGIFFSNNVHTLFNVLQGCLRNGVRKVVFTSSMGVYGRSTDPAGAEARWVTEDAALQWREQNVYNATKILGEDLCEHYARKYGFDAIALRCTRFSDDDYVADNLRKLDRGVDPRDVTQAHYLAAEKPADRGFEAYNIAAATPFRRSDLAGLLQNAPAIIERYFPGAAQVVTSMNASVPQTIGRVFDISKAEQKLGYRPRYNFAEFIRNAERET